MNNQKPWKSFDDQLSLLEERGLVFDNRSTARNYLSRIGYYRLWNINIIDRSNFIDTDIGWKDLNNAKIFLYFCILQQMLKVICPNSSWGKRFRELVNTFPYPVNRAISFHDMGLNSINLLKDWDLWQ